MHIQFVFLKLNFDVRILTLNLTLNNQTNWDQRDDFALFINSLYLGAAVRQSVY